MGGKTSTTTSEVSIPKEVLARYNAVNRRAERAASKPFKNYQGEFVAPVNQQQLAGIDTINNSVGAADPYFQQAGQYMQQGAGTAQPGELDIQKYLSPYTNEVVDSTAAYLDQGNEQAMSGSLGDAIKSGTFGGDRAGIAAAVLGGQQNMARAKTLADIKQQGYSQALGAAQQQQGTQLAADQADLARYLQAGQQTGQLGTMAQQAGLAGGEAQINAGTLQQQTQQAQDTAKYQQFLQKRGYPFQIAQFLANIAMGTGSLSGSTTTTEQPAPFFSDRRLKTDIKRIGRTDDGLPIYSYKYKGDNQTQIGMMADEVERKHPEAVGVAAGYKTVDYEKATDGSWGDRRATKAEGGGVAGPYGGDIGDDVPYGDGYVPRGWLKVGSLMQADPRHAQKPESGWDQIRSLWDTGKQLYGMRESVSDAASWFGNDEEREGKAEGGVAGPVPYLDKDPTETAPKPESYISETLEQQDSDNEARKSLMEAKPAPPPQSGAAAAGSMASGVGSLLGGIASLFALSDRRAKHSIKRIGHTDDGMPIYKFKYKGDDREQTHIGFMADEVAERHPDAVRRGPDGMQRVDLSKAHRFADGGEVPVNVPDPSAGTLFDPLLEAIKSKESPGEDGARTIHGGEKFEYFADHPRVRVPIKRGKDYSTAAGDFQMTEGTWDAARDANNLMDFSPRSQKVAATWLANKDYKTRTGRELADDLRAGNYDSIRKNLRSTWTGLKGMSDSQFADFFDNDGEAVAARADGGVVPRIVEDGPPDAVYGEVVERSQEKLPGVAPSAMMRELPGWKMSELDGETMIKARPPVNVPALETRTVKEQPTIASAVIEEEKPLTSVDYPGGVKPVDAPMSTEKAEGVFKKVMPAETVADAPAFNSKNQIFNRFMSTVKDGGVSNPYALAAIAATGDRESKFSPTNVNRTWSDPSQSGIPGTAGYIMSWRGNRLANLRNFAADNGEQPNAISPETQAKFLLQENPKLIEALNNAKSVEEAQQLMNNAWAFAGYNNPRNPETRARFETARRYLNDMGGSLSEATGEIIEGGKNLATGTRDLASATVDGVKNTAGTLGDFVSDTGSGIKDFLGRNKGNTDLILSILSGLGTMASSDSRYLGAAMLQGLGGGAKTYSDLQKQSADIRATDAQTRAQGIQSVYDSIKPIDGVNHIIDENGNLVKFWDAVRDKNFRGLGGKMLNESVRKMAIDAYRQGKDPNTMNFGATVQTKPVEAAQVEGMPPQADPGGGQIVQSETTVEKPVGVPWSDASQAALKANEDLLSRQPQQRIPLIEQTQKVVAEQSQKAQSAIDAVPALSEQATIVTDAIADKNMGTLGDWYAQNVIKPYNTLARSAGWTEVGANPDADTQQIMLNKLSTLNAQNLKPEDQSSYEALSQFMEVSPNLQMTPQAASMITSQQMIQNQRSIDKSNYMSETLRQSPTGEGVWTQANEVAFQREMGDLYLTERNNIANLMQLAEQDGRVRKFMHQAAAGEFKSAEDVQEILGRLLGGKVSPVLYRYFYRG